MRASYTLVALVSALPLLLSAATASAHFGLTMPPAVKPADKDGKGAPPCGPDSTMAATPTPAQGGHDLMLSLDETVAHDGFYRVALALKSRTEFPVDNVVYDSKDMILPPNGKPLGTSDHADTTATPKFPILADNLFPHKGAPMKPWLGKVTLPNVNCDRCILQVIEFMAGHGWNDPGGYFYHHCAELKITADPALPIFDPAAPSGGTGGTGGGGGTGGSSAGAGAGGVGVTTAGTGGAIPTGGTAGATTGGASTAGAGTTAGTAATTAGAPGTAGAGGTGTGLATTQDDSSCGLAKRSQGPASALAALGLLFALGRRRRAR